MTIARPKRRAVSTSTLAIAGPSRRCTWKSSGRRSVMRSISRILLGAFQGSAIQLALRQPGDARRELGSLARRECFQQHAEHALGIDAFRCAFRAAREHQHELALLPVRARREPPRGIAERQARDFLEFLAELARDDDLALKPEARLQVLQRG